MATKAKKVAAPDEVLSDDVQTEIEPGFEEWNCQIRNTKEGPTFEKMKKIRDRVLISEEQAELWNDGVLHGGNNYAMMYFRAE